jgi:hypothetical protein
MMALVEILDGPWQTQPLFLVRHPCCEPDPSFAVVAFSPEDAMAVMHEHRAAHDGAPLEALVDA